MCLLLPVFNQLADPPTTSLLQSHILQMGSTWHSMWHHMHKSRSDTARN